VETELFILFYEKRGIRPGAARSSRTKARRRTCQQIGVRVEEVEGAKRGGREEKKKKSKARNPGRPSEKSEHVPQNAPETRVRGAPSPPHLPLLSFSLSLSLSLSVSVLSPCISYTCTPILHRYPTHAVLAGAGLNTPWPNPGQSRAASPPPRPASQ
jgi:hypothetical protein